MMSPAVLNWEISDDPGVGPVLPRSVRVAGVCAPTVHAAARRTAATVRICLRFGRWPMDGPGDSLGPGEKAFERIKTAFSSIRPGSKTSLTHINNPAGKSRLVPGTFQTECP